MFLTKKLALAF